VIGVELPDEKPCLATLDAYGIYLNSWRDQMRGKITEAQGNEIRDRLREIIAGIERAAERYRGDDCGD